MLTKKFGLPFIRFVNDLGLYILEPFGRGERRWRFKRQIPEEQALTSVVNDGESAVAHYIAGTSLLRLNHLDEGEVHLLAVERIAPKFAGLNFQLGYLAYSRAEALSQEGAEDKAKPLTDQEMVEQVSAKGFKVARRTIAKYREELRIPTSNQRKILY